MCKTQLVKLFPTAHVILRVLFTTPVTAVTAVQKCFQIKNLISRISQTRTVGLETISIEKIYRIDWTRKN